MSNVFVVAVDGPAGSGKSSVSKAAAKQLGFAYLDTGAAYRALAWYLDDSGVDGSDTALVIASLPGFEYRIGTDPDEYFVLVGSTEVTEAIREPRISALVSQVARVPEVRTFVNNLFRTIIASTEKPGIVVEGRDITTVVAPDAPVRILLTASEEVRAARRGAELTGDAAKTAAEALAKRDRADSAVTEFMTAAEGVYTLDSTHLDFPATIAAVVERVHNGLATPEPAHTTE
ncbi:(d)CMP kinase [Mycetocola sp. JXN-3]|uniref:(d)CMP kinase n=1 Tax=Mycetocola sp. JXN-3 TaxID=2116510 RepID=UPI00165CEDC2|nr:(d)CMP kinase [Mycetocola sp. JXN-3]